MKNGACVCIVIFAITTIVGCGDEGGSTTSNEELEYHYLQFVHFDSTEYRLVKRDDPDAFEKIPEPLVNWEQSLGEPFTDRNGNGIYEPGIDTFIVSQNPDDNQDLNGNGQYDGPDDPWSEGIPFDDIDGNGEFRPDPGNHTTGYEVGLPYADFNSNKKHDGDLEARYGIAGWLTGLHFGEGIKYALSYYEDAVYRFVSDSGLIYDLKMADAPTISTLIYTDTGLDYRVYKSGNWYSVRLLNPGTIEEEDSTIIEIPSWPAPIVFYRWITLGARVDVDGISFSGLVKVRIGDYIERHDFYFSRQHGLVSYEFWEDNTPPPDDWLIYDRRQEYYFRRFDGDDPLIFPTTR